MINKQKAPRFSTRGIGISLNPIIEQNFYDQDTTTPPKYKPETLQRLADLDLEAFVKDLIVDAMSHALPGQWERRAQVLEWARPQPSDYIGLATSEEIAAQDKRLTKAAAACRLHAAMLRGDDLLSPEYAQDILIYQGMSLGQPLQAIKEVA